MEDWEYEALKRDIAWMPAKHEERRPVGRPKGSRNKTKKKPRIYVNMRDIFAEEPEEPNQGVEGLPSADVRKQEGVDGE